MQLTALETAVLNRYCEALAGKGFPALGDIRVADRMKTMAGKFVYLKSRRAADLRDWICELPDEERILIEFEGENVELHVNLFIHEGRPATLEFFRPGRRAWSGSEDNWRLRSVKSVAM